MKILIPSNNLSNLRVATAALFAAGTDPSSLIVIDDGLPAEAADLGVQLIPGIRPFVWARNINLGIQAAGSENVVVMGDDVILLEGRMENLDTIGRSNKLAVLSAAIRYGVCSVANQRPRTCNCTRSSVPDHIHPATWNEPKDLAFICIWLARRAIEEIGLLDERFIGYGYDDMDYCYRLRKVGLSMGVTSSVVVDHGSLISAFRSKKGWDKGLRQNAELYREKWGKESEI
jgi:GT2 family glycosyltransferase